MNYRSIQCVLCGKIIGRYPVFSHSHDEEDTGDAEYHDNYGGKAEGENYCFACYPKTDTYNRRPEDVE